MVKNEQSTALFPSEAVEEKVCLSDRFSLWIGICSCSKSEFIKIVLNYRNALELDISEEEIICLAKDWASTKVSCSGCVARQFISDLKTRMLERSGVFYNKNEFHKFK